MMMFEMTSGWIATAVGLRSFSGGGITDGDWLSVKHAWLIAAVTIIWQQQMIHRHRREDQERQARRDRQERDRQARIDRQGSWQAEYDEIRGYQLSAETIVGRIVDQPSRSRAADDTELEELERRYEAVSRRCQTFAQPLLGVATTVEKLRKLTVPSDDEVQDAYRNAFASGAATSLGSEWFASALGAKAVDRYRAAVDLQKAIDELWTALHQARGDEL